MHKVSGPITVEQAIDLARQGENIGATSAREARQVASAVSPIGDVIKHTPGFTRNGVRVPDHFHPVDALGEPMAVHIYY
jgi:hypothetical protein